MGVLIVTIDLNGPGMALGPIAVAIGALVGYAIRKAGRGTDLQFAVLRAVCAASGWATGTVLCDVTFLAKEVGRPFLDVLTALGSGETIALAFRAADAMDIVFLAIAVWEGWKLARAYRR